MTATVSRRWKVIVIGGGFGKPLPAVAQVAIFDFNREVQNLSHASAEKKNELVAKAV